MGRRTLLLVAALLVAALGTVAVFLYAQNARTAGDAAQELVTVLVAKTQIDVSTTGAAASANGAFEQAQVRSIDVTPGALSDVTPIANLVATVPIFPGQQIISAQWGTAAATSGLSIPEGGVAISVQLGDPERVAGFVSPGSSVAIIASGTGTAGNPAPFTRTLLANVPVIGVGPSTVVSQAQPDENGDGNVEQIPTAILTLGVSQEQAEKIIFAQGNGGQLYFALMNDDSKVTAGAPGVTDGTLFR